LTPQSKVVREIDRSLQAAFHERHDFVSAHIRPDEVRLTLIERQQPVLIGRQAEEVALLLDPFDRRALRAAAHAVLASDGFVFGVIGFVAHRVPAGIGVRINIAVRLHAPPDFLHGAMMTGLGGTDEAVERNVQPLVHLLEASGIAGREIGDSHALLFGSLDHLQTMLVGAGQEEHVLAVEALEARQRVGRDRFIGVADMGRAVRVGDGCGDVKALAVGNVFGGHGVD
jgi:hypothetical protein